MKKLFASILLGLALLAPATFTGCKSPEQAAYATASTVVTSVDTAMNVWGDRVRAGKTTAEQEAKVRAAYEKYQAFVRIARDAAVSIKLSDDEADGYQVAINAVVASAGDIVQLVQLFTQGTK